MIKILIKKVSVDGGVPPEIVEKLAGCILPAKPGKLYGFWVDTNDIVEVLATKDPQAKRWCDEHQMVLPPKIIFGEGECEIIRPE